MDSFRTLAAALLVMVAGGAYPITASSQNFPNKPIRFIAGGAGSPADMRARQIAQKLRDSLGQAAIRDQMIATGAEPGGERPEKFAAFIRTEVAKWGKVIKDAGIVIQ